MAKSNYGRFSDGFQVSGVCLNLHQKGKVFYVCNSTTLSPIGIAGSDGNDGKTPDRPLATIKGALSLCVASRGDKIVLMPGHAETVSAAAGLDLNVAGVDIVGDTSAQGGQRPTITLGTANTATVRISANDVNISNILFVANFLNIAACIVVTAATDAQIVNCEFRDTSSVLNFVKAIQTDSTANHADGLLVSNCFYLGLGTTATTTLVNCQAAINRMSLIENEVNIQGSTATSGALCLATSNALTGAQVLRNNVQSNLTTSSAGSLIVAGTGGSGIVRDNCIQTAGGTDLLITASSGLSQMNNLLSAVADASGYILPAQDA